MDQNDRNDEKDDRPSPHVLLAFIETGPLTQAEMTQARLKKAREQLGFIVYNMHELTAQMALVTQIFDRLKKLLDEIEDKG